MRIHFSARRAGLAFLFIFLCPAFIPVPASAAAFQRTGGKWAVCIGISDYRDPDLRDLAETRNDAAGLASVLRDQGGFDHVLVLTDDSRPGDPSYPSGRNIVSALRRVGKSSAPGDLVLVFFSGHGVTDPGGRTYLLPADAKVRNIPGTGIPLSTLLRQLGESDRGPRILMVDGARADIWTKGPHLQPIFPDRYLRNGVSAVFYAAKKGSFSHVHDKVPYSVFSRYLIEGMSGNADVQSGGDGDGFVSLMELASYVNENVHEWSIQNARKQSPYIKIFESEAAAMHMARAGEVQEEEPARVASAQDDRPKVRALPPSRPVESQTIQVIPPPKESAAVVREKPVAAEEKPGPAVHPEKDSKRDEGADTDGESAIVLGAPAPDIKDVPLAKPPTPEVRVAAPKEPPPRDAPPEAPALEEPPPESSSIQIQPEAPQLTEQPRETEPGGEPRTTTAAAVTPPPESPVAPVRVSRQGEEAAVFETEDRDREERVLTGGEAPTLAAQTPSTGVEDLRPGTAPPVPMPEPVSLRQAGTDISHEAVRSLLLENNFYSTCWTYNGDFCNPDGDFVNAFKDNNDGTVTDLRTRLMWQKAGSPGQMTWAEAGEYIKKLNSEGFAGHTDWRLPTVAELASLMERSWLNEDLFVDPVFSSDQKYCWSSDTQGMERAWKSNFHLGFLLDFPMTEASSIRAVRSLH